MRKNILSTLFTKGSIALLNFFIVIISSKYLGADARGVISLLVLNINVVLLINDLIGGGALVYLVPRLNLKQLLFPSYAWAIITACLLSVFLNCLNIISEDYFFYMLLLSALLNFTSINNCLLLGREMIAKANILSIVQVLSLFIGLFYFIFYKNDQEPSAYFISLVLSYCIGFLLGIYFLSSEISFRSRRQFSGVLRIMFRNGLKIQAGNITQMINYRFGYYLLAYFSVDNARIGVYATGVAICESVWVISNSISMVQYARIANMSDKAEAQEITLRLARISFGLTVAALAVLLLLPSGFYVFIFGNEFSEIPRVIRTLCLGVASFGLSGIISHYFSGIGKLHISSLSSVAGLFATIPLGFLLISNYGISGAGWTATFSYLFSSAFLILMFYRETRFMTRQLLPGTKDFRFFVAEIKKMVFNRH
jgi:O-antigen/teichoic acid export membrane protein